MLDLRCPRCTTDLNVGDDRETAPHVLAWYAPDESVTVYHCQPCNIVAVVEGRKVAWYYPDGGEELTVARGLIAATLAHQAAERAFWSAPQTAAKADAFRTATAALKDATARFGAYYAAHPEARP